MTAWMVEEFLEWPTSSQLYISFIALSINAYIQSSYAITITCIQVKIIRFQINTAFHVYQSGDAAKAMST